MYKRKNVVLCGDAENVFTVNHYKKSSTLLTNKRNGDIIKEKLRLS